MKKTLFAPRLICPRCRTKYQENQKKCMECGVIFSRVDKATNKNAKIEIIHGRKNNVVYVEKLPVDVKKWMLVLLSGFVGWLGVHNFYVGKFFKGAFMLIVGIMTGILVTFENYFPNYDSFVGVFSIFAGIMAIFWIGDFFNILINRFKVPVALEIEK